MKTKTRYIYFDKTNGFITDILKVRKRGRAKYVTTTVDEVMPILTGEIGMGDLVVAFNHEQEEYVLLDRDNIIKLRYYGKDLYKIPKRNMSDYDLRIDVYAEGNVLEVTIDPTRMSTMYATDFREEVRFEEGTEIRLYIKNKDGDELLQTLILDAQELLDRGQMFFEFDEGIDQNDMSFYTHRVFDNIMWRKGKMKFLSPMKDQLRFEVQKADHIKRHESFDYHLVISNDPEGFKIRNNIESLKLVKIFDEIEFYIVDRYDPSILYTKFILQPDQLELKDIIIQTKHDLEGKGILYNHQYISVLMDG